MTAEKKPPFVFIVVRMKKPYGILFMRKPTRHDILETISDLILNDKDLDDCFETQEFDISQDIEEAFADVDGTK